MVQEAQSYFISINIISESVSALIGEIFEEKNFKIEIVNRLHGEEAGIKQSIMTIEGENAYGMLKYETGVHRLVRVSPFNAQNKRQTSFASVLVTPLVDETITINIIYSRQSYSNKIAIWHCVFKQL